MLSRHLFQGCSCIFQQDKATFYREYKGKGKRKKGFGYCTALPAVLTGPQQRMCGKLKAKMRETTHTAAYVMMHLQEELYKITPEIFNQLVSVISQHVFSAVTGKNKYKKAEALQSGKRMHVY